MNEKEKMQPKVRFREFTGENAPDWEQRKLGETVDYIKGFAFKSNSYKSEGIRIIRVSDLSTHSIKEDGDKIFINIDDSKTYNNYVINKDEIIITTVGSKSEMKDSAVGRPIIIRNDNEGLLNQNLVKLSAKESFDSNFIYNSLLDKRYSNYIATIERGNANQANIAIADLWEYPIKVPQLKEQQKIGAFFKSLDDTIALHQRKLELLEQLKNTLLSKMFPKSETNIPEIRFSGFTDSWKQRKLGEVVIRLDNLRIPITESNRVSGPTPYYGANGIQDYVEGYTHDGEYILIAEDGANDTNNYPIFRVHGKIWVNNHAHVLQTIDDIADNDYVAYALKSINIGPYLVGGSRSKLNADSLMKLEIKLPKLSEQIKVGQIFVKIDYQIKNYKQKLKNLKTIKKSLLNKLFI